MIEPHGGELVERVADGRRGERLRDDVDGATSIRLTRAEYQDALNIASGRYSPLTGFMTQNDFLKVVHDMTLEDGTVWPVPVTLSVDSELATELAPTETAALLDPDGDLVGAVEVQEVYKYNREQTATEIYGTADPSHPGVEMYLDREPFLVGGTVVLFEDRRYGDHDLRPAETRVLFNHRGWSEIAGFQTRNAPHRAHEYLQKSALELVDGLLVHPKFGTKKDGDYADDAIVGAYDALVDHYYPTERVALSVFPSKMRYAGPREAILDALVRKNQGCTHFVVGRDHAGVGNYYGEFESQEIFETIGDVGVTPLFYNYSFYCKACDGMGSEKICPHDDTERIYPSGTEIRETIRAGELPSEKVMRPEVSEYIRSLDHPFCQQQ